MVLHVTDAGPVRTLTLDNPGKKNALDPETLLALRDVALDTGHDQAVRVVRLQGAGGDFCSGSDVPGARTKHPLIRLRASNEAIEAIADVPQPVVARVDGVAVGAGLSLELASDVVIAGEGARFCAIFARRGMSPDAGCSWLLTRTVGLLQAKRLTLFAEMLTADEAAALGLVTSVVPREDLDGAVDDACERLAAGPPIALAQSKALLNRAAHGSLHDTLWQETAAQAVNFATDAPAAVAAYRLREDPQYAGVFQVSQTGE